MTFGERCRSQKNIEKNGEKFFFFFFFFLGKNVVREICRGEKHLWGT